MKYTVEEITENILQSMNLDNIDREQGSDLYTLARAVALSLNSFNDIVKKTKKSSLISEAVGEDLNNYAASVNLSRKEGSKARGSVLALTENSSTILENTVLTELESGIQFITKESKQLIPLIESKITIEAVSKGREFNLESGTELYNNNKQQVQFLVGTHRTTTGEICGDLSGGSHPESDEVLRGRVINTLTNYRTNSEYAIKTILLNESDVIWCDTQTLLPGYVVFWIESVNPLDDNRLNYLNSLVKSNTAAGVLTSVKVISTTGLDFALVVIPKNNADLDVLPNLIKQNLYYFLLSLSIGDNLSISELSLFLKKTTGVADVFIQSPTFDQLAVNNNSVFRPNTVNLIYDI